MLAKPVVKFKQSFEQPSPGLFSYGYITIKSSNAFWSSISMSSFISVGNTKRIQGTSHLKWTNKYV